MENRKIIENVLACPVCKSPLFLTDDQKSAYCSGERRHLFDFASAGYLNLYASRASGGDGGECVGARTAFLSKGYYEKISDEVNALLDKYTADGANVLDAGCGEGYYTSLFAENNDVYGIDVSKDAVKYASSRCKNAKFAVASLADIPLPDESVDVVINIFAPDFPDEILRVLKNNGRLIMVSPLENHLLELKNAIYDNPYQNSPQPPERKGFVLKSEHRLKYTIDLDNNDDITSLFKMTPYYYKTSQQDQAKLQNLEKITTQIEFYIAEYTLSFSKESVQRKLT